MAAQQVTHEEMIVEYAALASIQANVNTTMAGSDWIERANNPEADVEANRIPLDYHTAALIECYELSIAATAYKWWAPPKLDRNGAVMELVDILHFALSQLIADSYASDANPDTLEIEAVNTSIAEEILEAWDDASADTDAEDFDGDSIPVVRESDVGSLVMLNSACQSLTSALLEDGFDYEFWSAFWIVAQLLDVNPTVVAGLYRAKAELNRFRTRNGGVQGTYVKRWTFRDADSLTGELVTREDNAWLFDYVKQSQKPLTEGELATWLAERYNSRVVVPQRLDA